MLLQLKGVSKSYRLGKVLVSAVKDVGFRIDSGSFVTLSGPSGSGKSTLLNILGLIDTPDSGIVMMDGETIEFSARRQLTKIRREGVGFIFQSFNLIPIMNVLENVMYPLRHVRMTYGQRKNRAKTLLGDVGLDGLEKRFPNELSGGQRQRVAIARAVSRSPKLILADEPTANLDSGTARVIVDLLRQVNQSEQATFVMATHDAKLISKADNLLTMVDGEVDKHENSI